MKPIDHSSLKTGDLRIRVGSGGFRAARFGFRGNCMFRIYIKGRSIIKGLPWVKSPEARSFRLLLGCYPETKNFVESLVCSLLRYPRITSAAKFNPNSATKT